MTVERGRGRPERGRRQGLVCAGALLLAGALALAPFLVAAVEAVGSDRLAAFAGLPPARPFEPLPREGAIWPLLAQGLAAAEREGAAKALAWSPWLVPAVLGCLVSAFLLRRREPFSGARWLAYGLRLLLAGSALAGAASALSAIGRTADRIVREPVLAPPEDDRRLAETVLGELAWVLAREGPDGRIREALQACDLDLAEALAGAARLVGRPLAAETEAALDAARSAWGRTACVAADAPCLATGRGCRTTTGLVTSFALELTTLGDLRDLTREFLLEPEPDPVLVGLAATGLALALGTLVAPEAAVPLSTARAALKVGIRGRILRAPLIAELRRLLGEAVDAGGFLAAARRLDQKAMQAAIRPAELRPLVAAGEDLWAIAETGGRRDRMLAARSADRLDELPLFRRVALRFGEDSAGIFATLGRRLVEAFRIYRLSEALVGDLRAALAGLAASLWGLAWALARAPAERLSRRSLRALS